MNVGASAPEEYGLYFSWGNTDGHTPGDGYEFTKATYNNTPGAEISGNIPISQDAARVNMGGSWRMPTKEELVELFNSLYTTNEWVNNYKGSSMNGYLVTSKANGNQLFFPAAGYLDEQAHEVGSLGSYWSSLSENEDSTFILYFDDGDINPNDSSVPYFGYTVRGVQS